jgi:hypothetical protein
MPMARAIPPKVAVTEALLPTPAAWAALNTLLVADAILANRQR